MESAPASGDAHPLRVVALIYLCGVLLFGTLLALEWRLIDRTVAAIARERGAALFSLIDTAMGQASHSLGDGGPSSVTLECKINYIRPVSEGSVLCHAKVLHAGRRTQVVEAEVLQGDKLVAKAQGTFACV